MASAGLNKDLAERRGSAVRKMPLEAGGVAPNRVFIAELSELALPLVTHDVSPAERNRTVEFIIAEGVQ